VSIVRGEIFKAMILHLATGGVCGIIAGVLFKHPSLGLLRKLQTLDVFDRTPVALASRGFVVIAPNVRGRRATAGPSKKPTTRILAAAI
jgi:hypothetical protein